LCRAVCVSVYDGIWCILYVPYVCIYIPYMGIVEK
jgi:hypothetical protein